MQNNLQNNLKKEYSLKLESSNELNYGQLVFFRLSVGFFGC